MLKINYSSIYQWPLKRQIPIFAIIFIAVFFVCYKWSISDLKIQILAAQDQESDLKQQISMVISSETNQRSELTEYPVARDLLTTWQAKLITHSRLPDLLKQILKIGEANNIYFSLFNLVYLMLVYL